jgi:AraC-like DNA-binding protein
MAPFSSATAIRNPHTAGYNTLIEQLIIYYQHEKPYLNPKLKVDDVASKLNSSQKAIAIALRVYKGINFNMFTNQFRVEAARFLLGNPVFSHYSIMDIARNSGFGSKQSFYTAFEQVTGTNPGQYRKQLLSRLEK